MARIPDIHSTVQRLPRWLRSVPVTGGHYGAVHSLLKRQRVQTVCTGAACPNRRECWGRGTATFLLLGPVCTRTCGFCNIRKGMPLPPDHGEPERIAEAVCLLGLSYAVLTSVTRDDLEDGGAELFARSIDAIRSRTPKCLVEVLVPDFQGSEHALDIVLSARPDVLNHNIETVPSQYARVRPQAGYRRSLLLLQRAKQRGCTTKSGLMLGLGERPDEVRSVMADLREAGCDVLTIGQYLQPNKHALRVEAYHPPEAFDRLREAGERMGFLKVFAGPRVRSSYHADRAWGSTANCTSNEQ